MTVATLALALASGATATADIFVVSTSGKLYWLKVYLLRLTAAAALVAAGACIVNGMEIRL